MSKTKVKTIKIVQEDVNITLEYWVIQTECDFSNIMCKGEFGVEVTEANETNGQLQTCSVNNMFAAEDGAKLFAYKLAEEEVTTAHVIDIINDILSEQKTKYLDEYCLVG